MKFTFARIEAWPIGARLGTFIALKTSLRKKYAKHNSSQKHKGAVLKKTGV